MEVKSQILTVLLIVLKDGFLQKADAKDELISRGQREEFSKTHRTKRLAEKKPGFSLDDKIEIIRKHNEFRKKEGASNMEKMYWDDTLEGVAQNWAEKCIISHNKNKSQEQGVYSYVGENIFYSTGSVEGRTKKFMSWWYSELTNYTLKNNSCSAICLHYTQIVWYNTNRVGCGVAFCPKPKNIKLDRSVYFVVCDYAPGGNIRRIYPYKKGSECTECPEKKKHCDDGLCSETECDGKKCENGGKLIKDVCMCDCSKTGARGPRCEISSKTATTEKPSSDLASKTSFNFRKSRFSLLWMVSFVFTLL